MSVETFKPGAALTAQAAAALVVVLVLAAWQFSRGVEKSALEDARAERLRADPVAAASYGADTGDFTRIRLTGRYDPVRRFLVASRPGAPYSVFEALHSEDGIFLVNRGLAAEPVEAPPTGTVSVVAVAWPTVAATPLAEREPWPEEWPKRLRGLHVERMAAALEAHPREFRLQRGSAGVLRPASLAWDYAPGTHFSYTVQWLLIGAVVVVGYVVIGRRRGRTDV